VSFSGIDGSGKTTQIDVLLAWLRDAGLRVRLFRFWDDIAVGAAMRSGLSHKLFKSEKGIGSPDKPVHRRDKNVRAWYMTVARLLLYLLDAIRLNFVIASTSRKDADVMIFDRYLYDELANLEPTNPIARAYGTWLPKLIPRPDIAFLLDADPMQARARKPEYPLEFLRSIRSSYLSLGKVLGMKIIEPHVPEDVTRMVLREIPRAALLARPHLTNR
jgi:thymidylate kinase